MDMYHQLLKALDAMDWKYSCDESRLEVRYRVSNENITMDIIVAVRPDTKLLCFLSILPFNIPEDKQVDAILAACHASRGLLSGHFYFNVENRKLVFICASLFPDGQIEPQWFTRQMEYVHAALDSAKICHLTDDAF